jgi:hypothetical protein
MLSTKFLSGGGDRIEGGRGSPWTSEWGELTLDVGEFEPEPAGSTRFKNIGLMGGTGGGGFLLGGGTRQSKSNLWSKRD